MKSLNYCPACGLHNENVDALSRYHDADICSDCGVREAFEGDFWEGKAVVLISVSGGVASIMTCPDSVRVEIIDYDN